MTKAEIAEKTCSIENVATLLSKPLIVPGYQRPYKWTRKNIVDLLNDIKHAIEEKAKYGPEYSYRVGTVILYKNKNGEYEIVDGQQRIISLVLLSKCLNENFTCYILENCVFNNVITKKNIHDNYFFINEWFSQRDIKIKDYFCNALQNVIEVVEICVKEITESFQLFDSQNTRGKELEPHDLLKAYHLRAMKEYPYEMKHAVIRWEANDSKDIKELFACYLYPIWNWSHRKKGSNFTSKNIDTYKGISEASTYTYAKRASRAMPYFQITESFIAGSDFFEYVEHYLHMKADILKEIELNFRYLTDAIDKEYSKANEEKYYNKKIGYKYAYELFKCALFCYYDRFHNFDKMAVQKLFTWAMMLRVDMQNLGQDSINKYAIGGEGNDRYTNQTAMFAKIILARTHEEIANMYISVKRENDIAANNYWNHLYVALKNINHI